jgi:hypothetical protein
MQIFWFIKKLKKSEEIHKTEFSSFDFVLIIIKGDANQGTTLLYTRYHFNDFYIGSLMRFNSVFSILRFDLFDTFNWFLYSEEDICSNFSLSIYCI